MKKTIFKTCICLFTLLATYLPVRSQTYFQKVYYNAPYEQEGQDVLPTADGGYIMAGYTTNSILHDIDVHILKADAMGNFVWSKTYGGVKPDFINHMLATSDGNYLLVGYSQSYGGGDCDVLLLKIDPAGNLLWLKTYGGWGNDQGFDVIATDDGNYMIAGSSNSASMSDYDTYLVKIDPSGNAIWSKWIGGGGNDFGSSLKQCPDGGYAVIGTTLSFGAGGDAYLIKTDASGNSVWTKTFGGGLYDEGIYITANPDGSLVFLVRDSSNAGQDIDVRVIKTDAGGNVIWNKNYGGNRKDTPKMVQPTMDGGYVVAAITRSFGLLNPDMWILKLDANGDIVWTKMYGGGQHEHCYVVRELWDGSFIAAGKTDSYSPDVEVMFLKLSSAGTLSVGVDETGIAGNVFSLFPNPTERSVSLNMTGSKPLKINITDAAGNEIYRDDDVKNEKTQIDLGGQSAGVYFVTVQTEFESNTKKLILK